MLSIQKNNDIEKEAWDKLFAQSSTASWFQSYNCYQFYKELSFLDPFVYGVEEKGELKGLVCGYLIAEKGLIKSYFSRRAIIPGGLLLADNISTVALEELLSKVKVELQPKTIYIEIRNLHDYSAHKDTFIRVGFDYHAQMNYQIALDNVDNVFSNFSKSRRRQIKQSLKKGVSFQSTINSQDLIDFYKILKDLYNKKIKLPLFPFEFFETIVMKSYGKLLVVKIENKVIGGILCVGNEDILYEWFVCGLHESAAKAYPSVMATWAGIEFATNNGFKTFDFMGAGKPSEKYGVREFKARFGGKLVDYGRFLHVNKPFYYCVGKLGISIYGRVIKYKYVKKQKFE